jgi:methionyl-tRNA formyltransferase
MKFEKITLATRLEPDNDLVRALVSAKLIDRIVAMKQDLSRLTDAQVLMINWPYILRDDFINQQVRVLNVHNSLLPKYRGRHAFAWAMINGEEEVGYTLHQVDTSVDSGPIFAQLSFPIFPEDDINTLFARGWKLLKKWLPEQLALLCQGVLTPRPQDERVASYFKARSANLGLIRWDQPGPAIRNFVRALRPPYTPGAFIEHAGERFVVDTCEVKAAAPAAVLTPGQVLTLDLMDNSAVIACADGHAKVHFCKDQGPRTASAMQPGALLSSNQVLVRS